MSDYKKTAKDIAFERERVDFRRKCREMQRSIEERDRKIAELTEALQQKDSEITQLNDWVERLLEYTEISKEDLKQQLAREKEASEVRDRVRTSLGIMGVFGGMRF